MRCPNCQTMNPLNAKFCMECGSRLLICANCSTVNVSKAKFCIECGTSLIAITRASNATIPLPELNDQDRAKAVEASALLNGQTRPHLPSPELPHPQAPASQATVTKRPSQTGHLTAPEERRVVTIMFADITGSTPLADRLDPEDMRAILTGYFNLMTAQIRRHGGTVEKYIGDAVMAIFGAPVAHEDDPDRAIRAALDMQTALNSFNALRLSRDPVATRLQMRIGINTGDVAAPGAHTNRQDFLITGDAVNVAARLQQVATPDTILVGERTYLATRALFDFRALAPLQVKGKSAPLKAWGVQGLQTHELALSQHPRGINGLQAPLVGRDLELTLMHATYARVRDSHHSHLITLLGSPGIGKSRMAREFIAREEEAVRRTTSEETPAIPRVLSGHCPPYGEGITYWPLVEILRSLIAVRDGEDGATLEQRFIAFVRETLRSAKRGEDVEQVTAALLYSIGRGLRGDPHQSERREIQRSTHNKDTDKGGPQAALQRACRILLEALAQVQPLILVIDDLQWADEALLNLLAYLAGRITAFPILFLCLARQDFLERRSDWGGGQPNFTTIILDALTNDETTELISELLATHELPDVVLHTIQTQAEGNPFFVEEIVRMLIDQGVLVKRDGSWHISAQNEETLSELASPATPPEDTLIDQHYLLPLPRVPDTIQGVLAARVDLLPPNEKQVLQSASIIGRTFWLSALLELTEDGERNIVLQTLEKLIQRDFLEVSEKQDRGPLPTEQSFSFKHILIRDVVYNTLPRMRRSQKHAQLAHWLEEQVADRLESFAELLAYHYQQALINWSATFSIHALSPSASALDGKPNSVVRLTQAELVEHTIHYLTLAADKAYDSYYSIRAIQAYTEVLELLQEYQADTHILALMHFKLGCAYAQRANADEAWREYLHALHLLKEQPAGARDDLLKLYIHLAELATRWLGWFHTWLDMDEVRGYIEAGLQLIEDQSPSGEQASFLTYQAMWSVRQMKYVPPEQRAALAENALQSGLEALHIAETLNNTNALWLALDAQGSIYNKLHQYREGHATQHRRQTLQETIQGREELYDLYSSLGWSHEYMSEYATAASWFGRAWRIAQTMESPSLLLDSLHGRLSIWYQWERWEEACEVAKSILHTCEQYQQDENWQLRALAVLAELSYRTGQREESDKLLHQYRRLCEQAGTQIARTPANAPAQPLLMPAIYAAREDWPQALADLREVVKQAEPFPSPSMLAHLAELTVLTDAPLVEQQTTCQRAVSQATQAGARKSLAIAQRAQGRMALAQGDWEQAEQDLRQALEHFKTLDLPWEQGQTLTCLAQLHHQRAKLPNAARSHHLGLARLFSEQALGFFESLQAVHDARRVHEGMGEENEIVI